MANVLKGGTGEENPDTLLSFIQCGLNSLITGSDLCSSRTFTWIIHIHMVEARLLLVSTIPNTSRPTRRTILEDLDTITTAA